jgi:hypothetical protein
MTILCKWYTNLKQARDMIAIFEKEFKMEVNLILGI